MLDTLKAGDILLGDAYYATYFLLCELQRRGIDGVFEQSVLNGAARTCAYGKSRFGRSPDRIEKTCKQTAVDESNALREGT